MSMGRDVFLTYIRNELQKLQEDYDIDSDAFDAAVLRVFSLGQVRPILETGTGELLGFSWEVVSKKEEPVKLTNKFGTLSVYNEGR